MVRREKHIPNCIYIITVCHTGIIQRVEAQNINDINKEEEKMVRELTTSPIVFGAGGGTMIHPLGVLTAAVAATLTSRVLNTERFSMISSGSGSTTLTVANEPIAGTLSVFYTDDDGNRTVVPVEDISVAALVVTVIELPFSEAFAFTVRYRSLGTPSTLQIKGAAGEAASANLPIPANSQLSFAAPITGFLVDN